MSGGHRPEGGAGRTRCPAQAGRRCHQLNLISQGKGTTLDHPVGVAEQFTPQGRVLDLREYGHGNVNDTFLVTVDGRGRTALYFAAPQSCTCFAGRNWSWETSVSWATMWPGVWRWRPQARGRRFEVPRVLLTRDGRDHVIDPGGSFWRALSFIDAAETFDTIKDTGHAREVGYALGRFHSLLSDLAPDHLSDTLPGFHLTPGYLAHYDEVLERQGARPSPEVNYGLRLCGRAPGFRARPGGCQGPGQAQAAPDARRPQGQQRHAGHRHRAGRGHGGPGHGQARPGAL